LRTAIPLLLTSSGVMGTAGLLLVIAGASWHFQYASGRNDGIERMADFVESRYQGCAAFNASGDIQKYAYSLQGRTVTKFGSGPGALATGVHLFFLNPKDAIAGYGRMSPDLATWIRSHGTPVAAFPSNTYQGAQLWEVKTDQYDPSADVERIKGGMFVTTAGSRCGGYQLKNDHDGLFLREFQALGGKGVVGAPISRAWRQDGSTYQAVNAAILKTAPTTGDGAPAVRAVAVVASLAKASPAIYARYHLPPVRHRDDKQPTGKQVVERLNDIRIARAYLGAVPAKAKASDIARALDHLGAPLGPATRMPDGAVRQAFAKVVYERPGTAPDVVRMAAVGRAFNEALDYVPATALEPQRPPPLPLPTPARLPAAVAPFAWSLAVVVLFFLASVGLLAGIRRLKTSQGPSAESMDSLEEREGSAS
jgi:hypothetical protein